jgi:hypothetical protein
MQIWRDDKGGTLTWWFAMWKMSMTEDSQHPKSSINWDGGGIGLNENGPLCSLDQNQNGWTRLQAVNRREMTATNMEMTWTWGFEIWNYLQRGYECNRTVNADTFNIMQVKVLSISISLANIRWFLSMNTWLPWIRLSNWITLPSWVSNKRERNRRTASSAITCRTWYTATSLVLTPNRESPQHWNHSTEENFKNNLFKLKVLP